MRLQTLPAERARSYRDPDMYMNGERIQEKGYLTDLMTQRAWTSPNPPDICLDFWTSAYQAIDD